MRRGWIGRVLGGALFAGAWPLLAHAASVQELVSQGNGRGAPPCQSCHGAYGAGQAAAGFPRLAGLDAAYLARQLAGYAAGTRAHAVMQPIARALSADEQQAIATYYSRLPVPAPPPRRRRPRTTWARPSPRAGAGPNGCRPASSAMARAAWAWVRISHRWPGSRRPISRRS